MYKKICTVFAILSIVTLLPALFTGCGAKTTSYADLLADPSSFNGKVITVDGFYFDGFELVILAPGLQKLESGDWVPAPQDIWLAGGIPSSVRDRLYTQTDTPSGYDERYGKIRVTGTFAYGEAYGHLGGYQYQITVSGASVLAWTPS